MPSAATLTNWFQVISLLGSALVVFKLYRTGLYRRYQVFFWYFIFRIPDGIWPLVVRDISSYTYVFLWVWTTPLAWPFYILLVLELYRLVLERYKGLYTLGTWVMYAALLTSIAISIGALLLSPAANQITGKLKFIFPIERGVDSGLVIFILLILLFLSQYHARLSRNVVVHAVLYSTYFLSNTLVFLLRTLFGVGSNDVLNVFLTGISAVCVFAWFFLLTPKGEEVHEIPTGGIGADHEARLVKQLESLNSTVLKARQKK